MRSAFCFGRTGVRIAPAATLRLHLGNTIRLFGGAKLVLPPIASPEAKSSACKWDSSELSVVPTCLPAGRETPEKRKSPLAGGGTIKPPASDNARGNKNLRLVGWGPKLCGSDNAPRGENLRFLGLKIRILANRRSDLAEIFWACYN